MKFSPFFNQFGYLVCFMEKGQAFKIKLSYAKDHWIISTF